MMKKFSKILEGRKLTDLPDSLEEVVILMENQKEYGNCSNLSIAKGYCTKLDLSRHGKAQSIQIKSLKKMKDLFGDGEIPDKWLLCVKSTFKYEPILGKIEIPELRSWDENKLWTIDELDELSNRVNSIKTLVKRLKPFCRHVLVSPIGGFEGTNTGESLCVFAVLEQ